MKKLLLPLLLLASVVNAQVTNFNTIVNTPFSDPEINNFGRGAQYWNGTVWDNSSAPQIPQGTNQFGAKTWYNRKWWTDVEAGQGVYTFTKASLGGNFWRSFEYDLELCAKNGMLYGFGGIMTSWDNQGEIFYDGGWAVYPQYLHNLMQAETTTKDWKYANGNIWVPNWNSPSYLARWQTLNDTILKYIKSWSYTPTTGPWAGKLVKGSELLYFVDLRGFGNYGEWHTYPWGDDGSEPAYAKATDSTFKKLIDIGVNIWGDYPLHIPVGAFDDNPWGEGTAFTTWYALTRQTRYGVLGWRRDNIGDVGLDGILIGNTFTGPGGWKADTAILNRWKYAMITGEPLNGGGTCCPYYWHVRSELNNYHYSTFGNGNYGSTAQSVFDSMQVYFKMSGYRYNFGTGNISSQLVTGKPFVVTLNWRNVGVAPLYLPRFKVRYKLVTSTDSVVQTFDSKLSLRTFLPRSTDSAVVDTFTLGMSIPTQYTYKLVLYIEDTLGYGIIKPAVIQPTLNTNGSLTLKSGLQVLSAPLPVKWSNVYLQPYATYNKITWKAPCSPFTARFAVQRSTDGIVFSEIGSVPPVYNCLTGSYQYIDNIQSTVPLFYRLKGIDIDSTATYSVILKANPNLNSQVTLNPNPVTGNLIVGINNDLYGQGVVQIYNNLGQLVKAQNFVKTYLWWNVFMNLSSLPSGTYSVNVRVLSTLVSVKTIVKN